MTPWQEPPPPGSEVPTDTDDDPILPTDRPPADRDEEAQRAPGAGEEDADGPAPPMRANSAGEHVLDGPGIAREPVGNDNIREGRVGGVMGPAHPSMGQGQGG